MSSQALHDRGIRQGLTFGRLGTHVRDSAIMVHGEMVTHIYDAVEHSNFWYLNDGGGIANSPGFGWRDILI